MMAPNPVAVIRSYVDGTIPLEDERVQILMGDGCGWVTKKGHLTIEGAKRFAYGWGTKEHPEPFLEESRPPGNDWINGGLATPQGLSSALSRVVDDMLVRFPYLSSEAAFTMAREALRAAIKQFEGRR